MKTALTTLALAFTLAACGTEQTATCEAAPAPQPELLYVHDVVDDIVVEVADLGEIKRVRVEGAIFTDPATGETWLLEAR